MCCQQGSPEDKWEEAQAAKEGPDVPEVDEEGKPLSKKARKALLQAAEKERERRREAEVERIEAQVMPPHGRILYACIVV